MAMESGLMRNWGMPTVAAVVVASGGLVLWPLLASGDRKAVEALAPQSKVAVHTSAAKDKQDVLLLPGRQEDDLTDDLDETEPRRAVEYYLRGGEEPSLEAPDDMLTVDEYMSDAQYNPSGKVLGKRERKILQGIIDATNERMHELRLEAIEHLNAVVDDKVEKGLHESPRRGEGPSPESGCIVVSRTYSDRRRMHVTVCPGDHVTLDATYADMRSAHRIGHDRVRRFFERARTVFLVRLHP